MYLVQLAGPNPLTQTSYTLAEMALGVNAPIELFGKYNSEEDTFD